MSELNERIAYLQTKTLFLSTESEKMSSLQEYYNYIIPALNHKVEVLEFEKSISPSLDGIVALKKNVNDSKTNLTRIIIPLHGRNTSSPGMNEGA